MYVLSDSWCYVLYIQFSRNTCMFMEENLNQMRHSCGSTHLVRPDYMSQKVWMCLIAFQCPWRNLSVWCGSDTSYLTLSEPELPLCAYEREKDSVPDPLFCSRVALASSSSLGVSRYIIMLQLRLFQSLCSALCIYYSVECNEWEKIAFSEFPSNKV